MESNKQRMKELSGIKPINEILFHDEEFDGGGLVGMYGDALIQIAKDLHIMLGFDSIKDWLKKRKHTKDGKTFLNTVDIEQFKTFMRQEIAKLKGVKKQVASFFYNKIERELEKKEPDLAVIGRYAKQLEAKLAELKVNESKERVNESLDGQDIKVPKQVFEIPAVKNVIDTLSKEYTNVRIVDVMFRDAAFGGFLMNVELWCDSKNGKWQTEIELKVSIDADQGKLRLVIDSDTITLDIRPR